MNPQAVPDVTDVAVGVLGHGSIGSVVASRLAAGDVPGARLAAVISRRDVSGASMRLDEALRICDVIVECAGQDAVRAHGVEILEAGCDLILTSVGALSDIDLRKRLDDSRPGRVVLTNGAVGGLDILAAAYASGGLETVSITSTKKSASLLRPWMSEDERERILEAREPMTVFTGTPEEAARLFPESLNVAVAVDVAVGAEGATVVRLVADPDTLTTRHEITADGPIGHYSIIVENRPSADNPRSSAVVPFSVLRTVDELVRQRRRSG